MLKATVSIVSVVAFALRSQQLASQRLHGEDRWKQASRLFNKPFKSHIHRSVPLQRLP